MKKLYYIYFFLTYSLTLPLYSSDSIDELQVQLIKELEQVLHPHKREKRLKGWRKKIISSCDDLFNFFPPRSRKVKENQEIIMQPKPRLIPESFDCQPYWKNFNKRMLNEREVLSELNDSINKTFTKLKDLDFHTLLVKLRSSKTFTEEYKLLRLIWLSHVEKILKKPLKQENFVAEAIRWQGVSRSHFKRETTAIVSLPPESLFSNEALGILPNRASVRLVFDERGEVLRTNIAQASLSLDEKNFLYFLTNDVLVAIKEAPLIHRLFFMELNELFKAKLNNTVNKKNIIMINKIVLNTFFLYVINPLILEYRIEKILFSKSELYEFELQVREEFLEQPAEESIVRNKVLRRMKETAEKRLSGDNLFEAPLIQALMQSFGVSSVEPESEYDHLLESIKHSLVGALLHVQI